MEEELIQLTEEQKEDLERLAALGYGLRDMALYFKFDYPTFRALASDEDSLVSYHIARGNLIIRANADMQLMISAEAGNLTAIQQLAKAMAKNEYKEMLRQLEADEF